MKTILMSVKPQYVAKILNGEKTIEIRKRFPLNYRGWVYIYCTKDNKNILIKLVSLFGSAIKWDIDLNKNQYAYKTKYNGKVVARFYCDNVEEIKLERVNDYSYNTFEYMTQTLTENELLKLSCLSVEELNNYLTGKSGYAIHISQLEIFDKPKYINEYRCYKDKMFHTYAPQSWQYVEDNL